MDEASMPLRSAAGLAAALERGDFSAAELVELTLARLELDGASSVFISLMRERAMEDARASDDRRRKGACLSAWDGIPLAWKDNYDIEGMPTTVGSDIYRAAPPARRDAALVAASRATGLVAVGKTNMTEFAYSGLGLNPHYGTPENPGAALPDRAPGGSSSGSAVAVAAGLVPVAIGSDTAGSVRVPASFCGVWGFKASQGHHPLGGVYPLSSSLDSVGHFANSAEDLATLDTLLRGDVGPATRAPDLRDLEFLIPETVVFDDAEPGVRTRFDAFVRHLEAEGARIERGPMPAFAETTELFRRHGTLTVAEAYTYHHDLLASDAAERMDQRVRRRMETAKGFSAQDYITLQWARRRLTRETAEFLGGRFLLFPTVAITAPSIAVLSSDDGLFATTNLLALRNTMLGNYLGTPGVSIPIGTDDDGLPVGALISAPQGHDTRVLAAARRIGLSWQGNEVSRGR
jgi:aspartyl-tRNA(Asn)/glutamyl-tRNA(Gln) amidotransferase subunit A